eukprot:Gb_28556 [translate_table: standard]
MQTQSLGGTKYFMTFIDDFSRRVWVYFLRSKSQAFNAFKEFKQEAENQCNMKIKVLRSYNGGGFTSKECAHFCNQYGIRRQFSAPYTPQQNGVVERMNRTLVEKARFWVEAVYTVVYLLNRSPTKAILHKTPEEAWSGRKLRISHLKVFGSTAYAWIPHETRTKLQPKSKKLILTRYSDSDKAYRLVDIQTNKVSFSRDVVVDEETGPFQSTEVSTSDSAPSMATGSGVKPSEASPERRESEPSSSEPELSGPSMFPDVPDSEDEDEGPVFDEDSNTKTNEFQSCEENDHIKLECESDEEPKTPSRSSQVNKTPITYRRRQRREEEIESMEQSSERVEGMQDEDTQMVLQIVEDRRPNEIQAQVINACEPDSFDEACKNQIWIDVMQIEYNALLKNQTWHLVDLPQGKHAINCKWVYKTKFKVDGTIDKHKARLVTKGFAQIEGIDYEETFAPTTIRILPSIAAQFGWEIHQMDMKTAFLNDDLEEEVYTQQPLGFVESGKEDKVCKLIKALYGLKQAPRAWYKKIDEYFRNNGFKRSDSDPNLYIKNQEADIVIIIVYVDDLVITSSSANIIL